MYLVKYKTLYYEFNLVIQLRVKNIIHFSHYSYAYCNIPIHKNTAVFIRCSPITENNMLEYMISSNKINV